MLTIDCIAGMAAEAREAVARAVGERVEVREAAVAAAA